MATYNPYRFYFDSAPPWWFDYGEDSSNTGDEVYSDTSSGELTTIVSTVTASETVTRRFLHALAIQASMEANEIGFEGIDLLPLIPETFRDSSLLTAWVDVFEQQFGRYLSELDALKTITNPYHTGITYIGHLARLIGYTYRDLDTLSVEEARKLLIHAIDWYKLKGTYTALEYVIKSYQFGVTIYDMYTEGNNAIISHYKMNDSAGQTVVEDSAGNNTGTSANNVTSVTGKISSAISFNGTNDTIQIAEDDASLSFGNASDFSVIAWIKTSNDGDNIQAICNYDAAGFYYMRKNNTNKMEFTVGDGTNTVTATSNDVLNDDVLHQVIATCDRDGDLTLYVDGVAQTSGIGIVDMSAVGDINNSDYLYLGSLDNTSQWWEGTLDDVRIYNKVLSAVEVSQLYNDGNGTEEDVHYMQSGSDQEWFVGAEDENPAGLSSNYYKSPHYGVEIHLGRLIDSDSLFTAETGEDLIFDAEKTRPAHTVAHYRLRLQGDTNESGDARTLPQNIMTAVTDDWTYQTVFFDDADADSNIDQFDESGEFDNSENSFLNGITTWKLGTGNYGISPDESAFALSSVVLTDTDVEYEILPTKIRFTFTVPKASTATDLTEAGLYSGSTLMVGMTFPKIDLTSDFEMKVVIDVYRSV